MSKPIILTKEYISGMVEEFRKNISEIKMTDGKITFTKSFEYTGDDNFKACLVFTPSAYVKMVSLLNHFDTEIAWHGTVERRDDATFIITDIVVYPQVVSGATVNTDQEEYQKWTMTLEDDYFNAMRMQGHSHVNMGTSPSGVDSNHQQLILSQLKGQDYYVFMIFNKRLEHTIKIYDYSNNIMYEDKDITVTIADERFDTESFIAESDSVVTRKTYAAASSGATRSNSRVDWYDEENRYHKKDGAKQSAEKQPSVKEASSSAKAKSESTAAKAKRGRPPKNAAKAKSKYAQVEMTHLPGYYAGRGYTGVVDWDDEVFNHRFDT